MELRDIIGTLVQAAAERADDLEELIDESEDDVDLGAHEDYKEQRDDIEKAVQAARRWLERTPT